MNLIIFLSCALFNSAFVSAQIGTAKMIITHISGVLTDLFTQCHCDSSVRCDCLTFDARATLASRQW